MKKRSIINTLAVILGCIIGAIAQIFKMPLLVILFLFPFAICWEFLGGKKYYEMDEIDIKAIYKSGYYAFMTLLLGLVGIIFYVPTKESLMLAFNILILGSVIQFYIVMQYYMKNPQKIDK